MAEEVTGKSEKVCQTRITGASIELFYDLKSRFQKGRADSVSDYEVTRILIIEGLKKFYPNVKELFQNETIIS